MGPGWPLENNSLGGVNRVTLGAAQDEGIALPKSNAMTHRPCVVSQVLVSVGRLEMLFGLALIMV